MRDLRIKVGDVLGYLASGTSNDAFVEDFPELTAADLAACLEFAAARQRGTRIVPPTASR